MIMLTQIVLSFHAWDLLMFGFNTYCPVIVNFFVYIYNTHVVSVKSLSGSNSNKFTVSGYGLSAPKFIMIVESSNGHYSLFVSVMPICVSVHRHFVYHHHIHLLEQLNLRHLCLHQMF